MARGKATQAVRLASVAASAMREDDLLKLMEQCIDDPVRFVNVAFDWGEGELADLDGLRKWQENFLGDVGEAVRARGFNGTSPVAPILMSTASGHGIGKSALTAFIILWIMSTRADAKGIVTANTSDQLRTKTWAELGKWHRRVITREWFRWTGSGGSLTLTSVETPESWRCDGITVRPEASEAFAGLHAADSTPFYIFDEASAVPDEIWDVAMGGLTDGEPMMFAFGNPTRNSGRFFDTHNRLRHRWATRAIDSREVEGTNKPLLRQWCEDYGEDSDFVRVRVRGVFPRAGSMQFIGTDLVDEAMTREAQSLLDDPVILGVDVARFGDDQSVICVRRGRDARTRPWEKLRGVDTMTLAGRVIEVADEVQADAIFVDEGGVGGGVIDRLRQLGRKVIGVNFGSSAGGASLRQWGVDGERYANKRAEIWGAMRGYLKAGGMVPNDPDLRADLTAVEYGFNAKNEILLERKEDMKKRGLASPDLADALAITFAVPVMPRGMNGSIASKLRQSRTARHDWDPMEAA